MATPTHHLLPGFPPSMSPSSHAVEANGLIFLTGQFGRNLQRPDDPLPPSITEQTDRALSNMEAVLAGLGLGIHHVVSVRVFLTSFRRDYEAMNLAYARHFPEGKPARTCIGVTELVRGALIELDCVAARP